MISSKKEEEATCQAGLYFTEYILRELTFCAFKKCLRSHKNNPPKFCFTKIVKNHFFIYTYASSLILQMETITAKSISTVAVMMAKQAIPTWLGLLFHVSGNWNIEGDDGTSSRIKQQKINDAILNTQLSFLCLQSWWHNFLHNRYTWTSTTHWAIFPIKWVGYLNHF